MTDRRFRAQPSCADPAGDQELTVAEARAAIRAAITAIEDVESVPLSQGRGRVLAADCVSPIDVPGHTNSAMDGYALRGVALPADGIAEFAVVATLMAGASTERVCANNECIRIMTGAPMPPGTDTVVMQEQVESVDERHIRIDDRHRQGQNVRQAGEDVQRGQRVMSRGRRLGAADLGVLASLGFAELSVFRRPRVAFFSTGDELRSLGEPLAHGEVYDSNRYTLAAMLEEAGAEIHDLGVVRDDPEALAEAFSHAAGIADVVVTSGGVSVGEADFTKQILAETGDVSFWKIAMKPGRPLTFGRVQNALFFGLPGNPVAVMLTFQQFVRPALACLSGADWPQRLVVRARSEQALKKKPGRFEFVRAILHRDDEGELSVTPAGAQGSGILTSMIRSNCLVLLPEDCDGVTSGDWVDVEPFAIEMQS
jgi:molybdopterin molybdotransferase